MSSQYYLGCPSWNCVVIALWSPVCWPLRGEAQRLEEWAHWLEQGYLPFSVSHGLMEDHSEAWCTGMSLLLEGQWPVSSA